MRTFERSSRELFAALSRRVSLLASMRHVRAFLCAIDLRPPTPTFTPTPNPPPPRAEPVAVSPSASASSQPAHAAALCVAPEPLLEAAELCAAEFFARLASPTPTTGDLSATQLPESGSSGTTLTAEQMSERRENAQQTWRLLCSQLASCRLVHSALEMLRSLRLRDDPPALALAADRHAVPARRRAARLRPPLSICRCL